MPSRTDSVTLLRYVSEADENSQEAEVCASSRSMNALLWRSCVRQVQQAYAGHAIGMQIRGRDGVVQAVAHLGPIKIALNYACPRRIALSFNLEIYEPAYGQNGVVAR